MQTVTIQTTQNIDIDYEVAGLGDRILARLIDIGFFIAFGLLLFFSAMATSFDKVLSITLAIIFGFTYAFYDLICEVFFNGQNFGKRIMKIKVISLNGSRPSVSQYLLRWLFRIVDFTLTSGVCALISVAVSYKKQRVGDIVAGTTLIKTQPRTTMDSLAFIPPPEQYSPVFTNATDLTEQELSLINDVLADYDKTGNSVLTYNLSVQLKTKLAVKIPGDMSDYQFLQTLLTDHTYLNTSQHTYKPIFTNVTQLTDKDVRLIHEVIVNYNKTHNLQLIQNMAGRIKQHLAITPPEHMEDYKFLQTIVKDYSHITADMGV